jgi:hypothetical protein
MLAAMPAPHISTTDDDGVPMVVRAERVTLTDDGFTVEVAGGVPWPIDGPSTLCFSGQATFVGVVHDGRFVVERQLPDLPLVTDPRLIFDPSAEVRAALTARLDAELARRGARPPVLPPTPP